MLEKFSDAAKDVIRLARSEASKHQAADVRPDHVLIALMQKQDPQTINAFRVLGTVVEDFRSELELSLGASAQPTQDIELPLNPDTLAAMEYAHREAVETRRAASTYQVTPLHLLIGLARVPGITKEKVVPTKKHMEKLREHTRGASAVVAPRPKSHVQSGVARLLVVWDPDVLSEDEYAELISLLGDLVRSHGGIGLRRLDLQTVGVVSGVGVTK